MSVSGVLPTYDRAAALRVTLPSLLTLRGLDELIVVVDGSTDGTVELLAEVRDRVRVVRQPCNRGVTAARNRGAEEARGEWLVFLEDDCHFPPRYAEVLRAEALAHDAQVVGAPMVHVAPGQSPDEAAAAERARARGDGGLDGVTRFPPEPTVTPLLQAPVLVRRDVVRRLRFDQGYRGNAYREETDFFLRTTAAGYRCLLTPRTWFWEAGRFPGGQPRQPLRAASWTVRNNWRFLRRHERWLVQHGHISSAAAGQAAFLVRRMIGR